MTIRTALKRALLTTFVGANIIVFYYNWGRASREPAVVKASTAERAAVKDPPVAAQPHVDPVTTLKFDAGAPKLRADAKAFLLDLYNRMASDPRIEIEVTGYTDDTGDPIASKELSIKRAKLVGDYLAGLGVPRERMVVQGFGAAKLVTEGKTGRARALNNRVEVVEANANR